MICDIVKWDVSNGFDGIMPATKLRMQLFRVYKNNFIIRDINQNLPGTEYLRLSDKCNVMMPDFRPILMTRTIDEVKSDKPFSESYSIAPHGENLVTNNIKQIETNNNMILMMDAKTGYFVRYYILDNRGDKMPAILSDFNACRKNFAEQKYSGIVILPFNCADRALVQVSKYCQAQNKRWFAKNLHAFMMNEFNAVQHNHK